MSVDEVYKTVLYILNKEQRGYLTPEEFNKVATQVQLEIFEKYFEDLTQQLRLPDVTDSEYANRVKTIKEKISFFETFGDLTGGSPFDLRLLTTELHRLGSIEFTPPLSPAAPAWTNSPPTLPVEIEEVSQHEFNLTNRSKLTAPSEKWPIFTLKDNFVRTAPNVPNITTYYVRKPLNPRWGYIVGGLGQYIYDNTPYVSSGITLGIGALTMDPGTLAGATFPATYVNPTFTTSGTGVGAEFSITTTSAIDCTIDVLVSGIGYEVGDTITIDAAELGGGSTGPTITLTAANIMSNTALGSTNIEISDIDQTEVILKILAYTGVIIRDPAIVTTATQMAQAEDMIEQN